MSTELTYLTYVALFTALMWMPYTTNVILVRGINDAVGYPANPKPLAPWAERMKKAHYNAIENLAVFAALVLVAHAAGVSTDGTVLATQVYLWTRVAHFVAYTFAIPWVRTLGFVVGVLCQLTIAWAILS
ncbi:MAG TPA: MAPEG family protein [Thermoanaerobaculia bacterium]|nr:MAPEG family protein [Thermoanaerobaculia bacterium]